METALTEIMIFSGSAGITRKAGSSYVFRLACPLEGFSEYDQPAFVAEMKKPRKSGAFVSLA